MKSTTTMSAVVVASLYMMLLCLVSTTSTTRTTTSAFQTFPLHITRRSSDEHHQYININNELLTSTKTTTAVNTNTNTNTNTKKKIVKRLNMVEDEDSWNTGPSKSAMIGGAGVNNAGEPPFEIRGFSLGNLICGAGILITIASFAEYLSETSGDSLNVSGLGFVYGIPVFLAGAALKYAEIEPVPVYSTLPNDEIFKTKATETIQKIKQDVTRHRYGDEAHLDTTVKKLGLVVPGKTYPQLRELREEMNDNNELVFTMVWQSLDTPYKMWADERRIQKYETFFGPNVQANVIKIDAEQRLVGIQLTTKTTVGATTTTTTSSSSSDSDVVSASVSG